MTALLPLFAVITTYLIGIALYKKFPKTTLIVICIAATLSFVVLLFNKPTLYLLLALFAGAIVTFIRLFKIFKNSK